MKAFVFLYISRLRGNNFTGTYAVIPAKAGMIVRTASTRRPSAVIPAKAGIHDSGQPESCFAPYTYQRGMVLVSRARRTVQSRHGQRASIRGRSARSAGTGGRGARGGAGRIAGVAGTGRTAALGAGVHRLQGRSHDL